MNKSLWSTLKTLPAVLLALAIQGSATAQTKGMVVNRSTGSVTVFDADADTVLGTVILPGTAGASMGDCSITVDQTLGFVTDFLSRVWVIDIPALSLAGGTNPIPIVNFGEDTSITPDQKFVLVSDGSATQPISVIDIAARAQVSTFNPGTDNNSVEVSSDGSVLATSFNTSRLRRFTVDGSGTLTDTGEVLFGGSPMNSYFAPGNASGVVVDFSTRTIRSFTIPGLALVDTRSLAGNAICGAFNAAGDRVYVRTNGPARVEVFGFNSGTGAMGAAPLFNIPIAGTPSFFGMEQLTLSPDGSKLYVPQPGALDVYDATNGNFLTSITDAAINGATGVCIPVERVIEVPVDIKPQSCPNPLNVGKKGVLPVAVLGNDDFDVTDIDPSSVRLAGVPPLRSSLEDVATPLGAPSPSSGPIVTLAGLEAGPPVDPIHGNPTPPFPILGDGHHFRVEDEIPDDCVNVTYSFTWTPAVIAFFGGADVSSAAQQDRIRDAFDCWNLVTPGIEFTEVVAATATLSVGTAANFLSTPFPGALGLGGGLGSVHLAGPDTATNHHLTDHLAVQNDTFSWHTGPGLPPAGLFDYLSVAEQEIGHAIGLGHNAGDTSSVMFPFLSPGIRRAPPNAADETSLDFLYPGDGCVVGPPPEPPPDLCDLCTDEGPDGFLDLTLKFKAQEVVAALGEVADGECVTVELTGTLNDGTPIKGEDVVLILKKK